MNMKKLFLFLPALSLFFGSLSAFAQETSSTKNLSSSGSDMMMKPPVAKKMPKELKIHGYTLIDNYFWLRDRKNYNDEIIKYLEDENAYTEKMMSGAKEFQDALYKEMLGRIKQTDVNVPYRYGDYFYYSRTVEGKQYPIFCRKKGSLDATEEVILEMNEMAKGYKFLGLGGFSISDDGNLLAYSLDFTGYRQFKLFIKDLRSGQIFPETFERTGSIMWANDNKTIFYTTEDPVSKRSDKFWRHTLGNKESELIYEEKDELFDIGGGRSRDKKIIFLSAFAKTSTEVRYIPADQPNSELKVILPRQAEHEYGVDYYEGKFYITTNKNAKNSRVVVVPINDPSEKNWKEFIPHNAAVKINGVDFFADFGVISEKENGLDYLRVIDMKTKKSHRVETPENDYTIGLSNNPEFNTNVIRFNYTSFITPPSVFDYNVSTKERKLLKEQPVLGGYDKNQYVADRVWAKARDGVKVPISIVYKKGVKLDGTAPMHLYAYGSYGASMPPTFSSTRLSLIDRGAIYALAHIRGGGELGEEWRQAGRMMQKMNTFNDFIDSADWLIKNKYTTSDKLVISGGSAGGLLMGAVVNMRPDLFKAALAQVPFVDVINTMLDASLPLTTSEYLEWGNPNEKAAFDYMVKYSPYDNVKAQNYPVLMIQVSLNDSQVPYWEGAKWAAKLREMKTDNNMLLLKTNMGAGHGGSSGRYDALKEQAFNMAFILSQMGINK
jgi:oligopeptidase B